MGEIRTAPVGVMTPAQDGQNIPPPKSIQLQHLELPSTQLRSSFFDIYPRLAYG
jgi:hypothetical protein